MKIQKQSERKARTRQLVQAGGLLHKSGLLDAFSIYPGDDLQDYENLPKANRLLGFLSDAFERSTFDESHLEKWQIQGKRLMSQRHH